MNNDQIKVMFAEEEHCKYAGQIVDLIYESALQRGTGIARRSPEYIAQKIKGGKAVVALCDDRLIGFSYIAGNMVIMWPPQASLSILSSDDWGWQHVSRLRLSSLRDLDSRLLRFSLSPRRCQS